MTPTSEMIEAHAKAIAFAGRDRNDVSEDAVEFWAYTNDIDRARYRKMASAAVALIPGESIGYVVEERAPPRLSFFKTKPSISPEDMSEYEITIDPVYAAPAPLHMAVQVLEERIIADAIRSAYDRGYNDARNAYNTERDNAKGYRGRDKSREISAELLALLRRASSTSETRPTRSTFAERAENASGTDRESEIVALKEMNERLRKAAAKVVDARYDYTANFAGAIRELSDALQHATEGTRL